MSDLINSVQSTSDMIRAIIVTRFFNLEGTVHCPRLGKDDRRFSNMLNSDRKFLALTNVTVVNRMNGAKDAKIYPLIQVSLEAVEFIQPYLDEKDVAHESMESSHSRVS